MVSVGSAGTSTDTILEHSNNTYRKTSGSAASLVSLKATSTGAAYVSFGNKAYNVGCTLSAAAEVYTNPANIGPVLTRMGQGFDLVARTNSLAETYSRIGASMLNTVAALVTGDEFLVAIPLRAGMLVSTIVFYSGGTALSGGSNQWFSLRNSSLGLLGVTSDDTSTAWAANAEKPLNLATAYLVPSNGLYYLGIMVNATTVPTLSGVNSISGALGGLAPVLTGRDQTHTGLTNPASAPTTSTLATTGAYPWAYVK